jgi:MFS family permease
MTTQDGTSQRATIALTLLVLINLFNYIDRQILSAVESRMEETFFPESEYPRDPETKQRLDKTIEGKMGSLNLAFMVTYMLTAPLFGFLADRMPRWVLVGIGVTAWSLATGATGLAGTFVVLFLTRCLVGVGEAAYGPVAPTVISDLYPVQKRGSVMAIFYAAIPVGSALGYVLGGKVTTLAGGDWRWAFFVVVPPGLLLGFWCFLMKDPRRGSADPGALVRKATWADYKLVLNTPSYLLTTLGMTAMTFAMGGMAFFMPRYGVQRQSFEGMMPEEKNALFDEVNLTFGIIVVLSGLGATILGGIAGDRLKAKIPGAYFLVSAIAMGVAFPLILCALWTPFPAAWIFIFLACFCLFFNTGPTNTILANVTHPSIRASAFALNILIIHALGDAVSPTIIGFINGFTGDMTYGFLTVSFMCLLASVLWFFGIKHLERDTAMAPTRLAS